jgi:ppGpp synthetase/RelA/SpoT-type nucleotidyltranferase
MDMSNSRIKSPVPGHEELISKYEGQYPQYVDLANRVKQLLADLLEDISIQMIECRAKTVESLAEKVCRPGKNYNHELSSLPDLAGVRVIAHYLADIDSINSIIRKTFEVIDSESDDKADALDVDKFGYRSVHFVVTQKPERLNLPEWKRFEGMKVEIQVRTVLQHAWAAVSHALSYKHEEDVAKPLRRKLNRLAGLFELADEQFCDLRNARESLSVRYNERIRNGHYEIEITPDNLSSYIDSTGADAVYQGFAQQIGWTVVPFCHNNRYDDYEDLAGICDLVGIKTIQEFHKFLEEMKENQKGIYCLKKLEAASPGGWSASPLFIVQLILLASRGADVDYGQMKERVNWDGLTAQTALEVARKP